MTKKFLAMFLAFSMALSITACGGEKNNSDSSTAEVTTTTTSETTTASETTTPTLNESSITDSKSDYSWSIDELSKKIILNGKKISLPCTLKDLGNGYSFSKNMSEEKYFDEFAYLSVDLLYNDKICAGVQLIPPQNSTEYDDATIFTIFAYHDSDFSIENFKIGETKDNIIKKYGEPTTKSPEGVINDYYFYVRRRIALFYDDNNKIESIAFSYLPD
ncbi:MAG TPA: hypothetical protein PKI60_01690 [Oscillospiraceae bacterium]|nr:hypothetical protein [Oscillospiraceae bacterium]